MSSDLELLPVPVCTAASVAGPAVLAGELLGRVRAELPAVGGLGEREQVLVSAWLTGLRSAHPPRLRRGCRGLARLARRGAGNNRPMSTATASSFLNAAGKVGRVTISERIEAARRERRVLVRVSRAGWRLEQAERERTWALVSARAPEDPDSGEDTELDGRDTIADRLSDEVSWLRECADWLSHLDADSYPPAVNLRPAADWPDRAVVAVDLARVAAVIDRIAADVDELARARRVQDLATAAVLADPRAERRRRLAEPDLQFRAFCTRRRLPASSTPQLERAWDAWQAERYQRGEISQRPGYTDNPFRPR